MQTTVFLIHWLVLQLLSITTLLGFNPVVSMFLARGVGTHSFPKALLSLQLCYAELQWFVELI